MKGSLKLLMLVPILAGLPTSAFKAYDCESEKVTYETIDATAPEACPDPMEDYLPQQTLTVQIFQTDIAVPVRAYGCHAVVSKEVNRCGFMSIPYDKTWSAYEQLVEITPDACRKAIQTRELRIDGQTYNVTLDGVPRQESFFSHGSLDENDNCQTASFVSGGKYYWNSYERTWVTLSIKPVPGSLDMATSTIVFSNGLRAKFKDGVVHDAIEGTMVWETEDRKCSDTASQVYLGEAEVHQRKDRKGMLESIVMLENNHTRQRVGLVLEEPTSVCQVHCYNTQVRGIVGCLIDGPIPHRSFKSLSLMEIAHLHLNTNLKLYNRFEEVQDERCQSSRKLKQAKLDAATGGRNLYPLLREFGPGHTAYIVGAAIHVARCEPVEVTYRPVENCTQEIPVLVGNKPMFANPITFILQWHPEVVPCSPFTPVVWKIGEDWYNSIPQTTGRSKPPQLWLSKRGVKSWGTDFTKHLKYSVYTPQQIQQHRHFILTQTSREAVMTSMTNAAMRGKHGKAGPFNVPLSPQQMKDMIQSFGAAWQLLLLVVVTGSLIMFVINCLVRAYVLFHERGCGLWLLGSLSSLAFLLLRSPVVFMKKVAQVMTEPIDEPSLHSAERGEPISPFQLGNKQAGRERDNPTMELTQVSGVRRLPQIPYTQAAATSYVPTREDDNQGNSTKAVHNV